MEFFITVGKITKKRTIRKYFNFYCKKYESVLE